MLITGFVIFGFIFIYVYGHQILIDGFRPSQKAYEEQRRKDNEERARINRENHAREAERKSKMTPEQLKKEEDEKQAKIKFYEQKAKNKERAEAAYREKEAAERRKRQEAEKRAMEAEAKKAREVQQKANGQKSPEEMKKIREGNMRKICVNYGTLNVNNGFTPGGDNLPGTQEWTGNPNAYCHANCVFGGDNIPRTCESSGRGWGQQFIDCAKAKCPQDPQFYK